MKAKLFAPMVIAALVAACATAPEPVVPLRIEATLVNLTGESLQRVEYRSCGTQGWNRVDLAPVPSGATVKFQLSEQCVDLDAYYGNGKLAGSQRGVNRDYPFKWTIR